MIPSYVCSLPTGEETGVVYALDIGGSNLRVLKVSLEGNGGNAVVICSLIAAVITTQDVVKKEIPVEIQRGQYWESLFDFLAEAVAELTKSGKLGFTFSFPLDQKSLTSGVLLRWTKSTSNIFSFSD